MTYRRVVSVVNPLSFIRLANTISTFWPSIKAITDQSKISLSKLKTSSTSLRAVLAPSFDEVTRERILRSTGRRFALKIDVQRFYGSIYTHSIPWALNGKTVAKTKRKRYEIAGNALDEDVRKMMDGQTMGIRVGPDTSRIISELIASYIDIQLQSKIEDLKGIRVVDDYLLYFKNKSELDMARATIVEALRGLELDLNSSKEKIIELPEQIESDWYNVLRDFKFRNEPDHQIKDIIAYFDKSFHFAGISADDSVLSYSISKISATIFTEKGWEILEAFLLQALLKDSRVLPFVTRLIISHEDEGYDLDFDLISDTLHEFIDYHFVLDNHHEVSWAMWLVKQLKITVSKSLAEKLSTTTNSIVCLSVLDVHASGFIPKGISKAIWSGLLKKENLYNEYWLIAYEAVIKGWLNPTKDYIAEDPFFNVLRLNNVQFYDVNRKIDLTKIKVTSVETSLLKYKSSTSSDDESVTDSYPLEPDEYDYDIDD
nr:RNA-directed DNA polymerase [Mucilaginibacter sp. Bleaf8]